MFGIPAAPRGTRTATMEGEATSLKGTAIDLMSGRRWRRGLGSGQGVPSPMMK